MKKLNHKIVHETIARQFSLVYYKWRGGYEPVNYTYFHRPDTPHEPTLQIEVIPRNPSNPWLTIYVMLIKTLDPVHETQLLDIIEELYTSQTIGQPANYCISFNTDRPSVIF